MAVINFDTGIEGYHTYEPGFKEKSTLPASRDLAPEGGRVKDHLELYMKRFDLQESEFNSALKPNLTDNSLVSPKGYMRAYIKTLDQLRQMKKMSVKNKKMLDQAIQLLENVGDDIQLLNDYVSCLQKV